MRVETLDEAVQIRADFKGGVITPILMKRAGRTLKVKAVNGRWLDREGGSPVYFFSISTQAGDVFQLCLRAQDMTWHLCAVMIE